MSKHILPSVSQFTHRHGVSVAVIPAGVSDVDFWVNHDSHDPEDTEERIETIPLEQPYASAPGLLEALEAVLAWDDKAPVLGISVLKQARAAIARARGETV